MPLVASKARAQSIRKIYNWLSCNIDMQTDTEKNGKLGLKKKMLFHSFAKTLLFLFDTQSRFFG